jgi:hypothetical protein
MEVFGQLRPGPILGIPNPPLVDSSPVRALVYAIARILVATPRSLSGKDRPYFAGTC